MKKKFFLLCCGFLLLSTFKPEFIETKWDGIFAGLDAKRFDMIANQVGIKPDRQEKYDFSDPYIVSKAVLIVNSDDNTITKFEDLKGKKSAQSLTSNLTKIAETNGAVLKQVDGFNQAIDLLTSKRVDATINDSLSYLDLKKQKPDLAIKVVDEDENAQPSAVMFNKGNKELVDAVNKALTAMKADGTYAEMFQVSQRIVATTYEPLVLYIEVAFIYLLFCTILSILQQKVEKKLERYVAR